MKVRELKKLLRTLKKSSITINGLPLKVEVKVNQDGDTTLNFYTTSRERRPQAGANEDKQEKE